MRQERKTVEVLVDNGKPKKVKQKFKEIKTIEKYKKDKIKKLIEYENN